MLRNRKFQLIASLLIAVVLWLYVVGNVNPTIVASVRGIEVEMTGEDELADLGMSANLDAPETVDIVIRGSRSDVNEAKKSDIRATVDVSDCNYGKNEGEIRISFPEEISGVTIDQMAPEKVAFTVE
ncbi:MAG: CdaR family protein [Bacillota bacterium]|nr:CdaR family protein [Bacillota bacterium]